ncbi:MAG: acyl-CoA dehydrogenase family protein [Peptococcaceae bacterium]
MVLQELKLIIEGGKSERNVFIKSFVPGEEWILVMMEFDFNEEQKMIQKTAREFCQEKIAPIVRKLDEEKKIPAEIIKDMSNTGYIGMSFSADYKGLGADPVTVGLVAEEIARADISCVIPTFFLIPVVWGYIFNKYGVEKAKANVLPKVVKGEAFLGIAATEPNVGSDLANMKTVARKAGDNYIVNGEKMFISGISEVVHQFTEGGGHVTLVKTDSTKGTRGISLLYIPLKSTRGITTTILEDWGRRGISTGGFTLEDAEIYQDYLIGEENKGFYLAMEGFDYARAIISIVCCGAAMSALEQAMEYLKLRTAFGQPIGKFEGIQFKLAEHWAKLEAVKLLGYKALWIFRKKQAEKVYNGFEATKLCASAKLLAPVTAFEAINDAIQWFGAFGYTTECSLELALKGVRSYFWAEGSLEVMKIIVARELLGKDYIAYR